MTIYSNKYVPAPCVRQRAKSIATIDAALQTLIDDMFETMYMARGVGLAAPQIGILKCLAVIDVTQDKSQQLVLINPKCKPLESAVTVDEGCLSVPGDFATSFFVVSPHLKYGF